MRSYTKKPVTVEAITFDELVQHGRQNGANIVDGMPWSFTYKGWPISHERDDCYLIPTLEGTHNMTPTDMQITGIKGEIYPCKRDIFELTYTPVAGADDAIGIEQEIVAKGLTAPRVTPELIDAMMARVVYRHAGFHGTTSIVVAAFLDGEFYLGCGHSACVSKENFDPEIGFKNAKASAEKLARDKLWELEGYALRNALKQV